MKFFSFIAFLLFLSAACVQLNDPDPFLWISIYGSIAILSLASVFNHYYPSSTLILTFIYLFAVIWLSPNFLNTSLDAFASVQMKNELHELVRESWGLLICLIWSSYLYMMTKVILKKKNP